MRIAVIGVGAVGGYYGGRLAQAGHDVLFIGRGENLRALQTSGLRVESIKGDFSIHPLQAVDEVKTLEPVEMILVAVKAWQAPEAAEKIRPLIGADSGVIYLGNGVDAPGQLAQALGEAHVLGGLTRISAALVGPGHIRHAGIDPFIAFGELDGRPSRRVERLKAAFAEAQGVTVSVPDDILAAMWEKFIFIASISGIGAVTRVPAGALRSVPESRALLAAAIQEVTAVGKARGVRLADNIAARTLAFIDRMAAGVTASMQRDIMDGKPSELASQSGAVVRMGRETGVPTPAHEFIYSALLPQELKARGELSS